VVPVEVDSPEQEEKALVLQILIAMLQIHLLMVQTMVQGVEVEMEMAEHLALGPMGIVRFFTTPVPYHRLRLI